LSEPGSDIRPTTSGPLVFYDGECGLCDRFVQFVLRHDRGHVFRFAPLQGSTFDPYRIASGSGTENTVVLVDDSGLHLRSEAALRILLRLRSPWSLLGRLGLFVPRFLRDGAYRLVARSRYRLFGRHDACALADSAPGRFLP
jgi:predicted DCC family thiol-disulfide oxidoreductase YuxK